MSVQGEHELRERLSGLLDNLEPHPAPVASTLRQGQGIRRRRLAGAAACLVVLVAVAALLPGLLRSPVHVSPAAPIRDRVTVQQPRKEWASGVVAAGVTDGRSWKMIASGPRDFPTISVEGHVGISPFQNAQTAGSPASLLSSEQSPGFSEIFGTVSRSVTRIVVDLPGGKAVTLTPVVWKGRRWVGLILPPRLSVVRAIAYSRDRELAYAVPFQDIALGVWWQPGEAGPARVTKVIGSGVAAGVTWRVRAEIGPWGYCYSYEQQSVCSDSTSSPEVVPTTKVVAYISCGPVGATEGPDVGIAAARTSVRTVVLKYSNGTSATFRTVSVSGGRVFAYVVPKRLSVTDTREYGAAGQLVGTTSGAGWRC